MNNGLNLQAFGAAFVILAFIAAELASWYLIAAPASPLAWSMNMGLFRVFELARAEPSPLRHLFGPAALPVAALLLAGVAVARASRMKIVVAASANISFGFAIALVHAAAAQTNPPAMASLSPSFARPESSVLLASLLMASFAAFAASHISFLREIVSELSVDRNRGAGPAGSIGTCWERLFIASRLQRRS